MVSWSQPMSSVIDEPIYLHNISTYHPLDISTTRNTELGPHKIPRDNELNKGSLEMDQILSLLLCSLDLFHHYSNFPHQGSLSCWQTGLLRPSGCQPQLHVTMCGMISAPPPARLQLGDAHDDAEISAALQSTDILFVTHFWATLSTHTFPSFCHIDHRMKIGSKLDRYLIFYPTQGSITRHSCVYSFISTLAEWRMSVRI